MKRRTFDVDQAGGAQRCHAWHKMRRSASFAALVLALIAVSLLVLQPVCPADAAHVCDDSASACWSPGLAAPAQLAAAAGVDEASVVSHGAIGSTAVGPQARVAAAAANSAPLPVPRYHARSVRILS